MLRPWLNIALIVVALVLIGITLRRVQRRKRLGRKAWTTSDKLGVVSMGLICVSQTLPLL